MRGDNLTKFFLNSIMNNVSNTFEVLLHPTQQIFAAGEMVVFAMPSKITS
jgi:hypothetical protein